MGEQGERNEERKQGGRKGGREGGRATLLQEGRAEMSLSMGEDSAKGTEDLRSKMKSTWARNR
jgi:hypothetical protein